jgi:hypothetical protein
MGPYEKLKEMATEIVQEVNDMGKDEDYGTITIAGGKGHRDSEVPFYPEAITWAFNVIRALREAGGGQS